MKNEKVYLILFMLIIDLMVFIFTPKICPDVLIADYAKTFILQLTIILIISNYNFYKKLISSYRVDLVASNSILFAFAIYSFVLLSFGTEGGYIFGGQRYCSIAEVPEHSKRFL